MSRKEPVNVSSVFNMAQSNSDWEELRKFRFTRPERYVDSCMALLARILETDVETMKMIFSKVEHFDENRNVSGLLVTHQMVVEIEYLVQQLKKSDNLRTPLLFRKPGTRSRCDQLRQFLAERKFTNIEMGNFTPCDLAVVLKKILQDSEEPLLTSELYLAYCQIKLGHLKQDFRKNNFAFRIIFLLLPDDNYLLMRELLLLLHEIHYLREFNQMDAHSLAVCLAPSLLCPRQFTVKEFQKSTATAVSTLRFMIETAPDMFVIPTELLMDIREQKVEIARRISFGPNEQLHSFSRTNARVLRSSRSLVDGPSNDHHNGTLKRENKDFNAVKTSPEAADVYKSKLCCQKSDSFAYSKSAESPESDLLVSESSTESQGSKHKGFFWKFFRDKQHAKNGSISEKRKTLRGWLRKIKNKEQDETDHSCKGHTYRPNREEAKREKQINAVSANTTTGCLEVECVERFANQRLNTELPKSQANTPTGIIELLTPKSSLLNSGSKIIRKSTFVVRKRRSCISYSQLLGKTKLSSHRHSTYVLENRGSWSESLPSIFDSTSSDIDEVFPDELGHYYFQSTEDEEFEATLI